jgi:hypothetical protein
MADFSTPSNLAARFLDAAGCGKTIFAGLLKKISEARRAKNRQAEAYLISTLERGD